jgi:hypothetical protein
MAVADHQDLRVGGDLGGREAGGRRVVGDDRDIGAPRGQRSDGRIPAGRDHLDLGALLADRPDRIADDPPERAAAGRDAQRGRCAVDAGQEVVGPAAGIERERRQPLPRCGQGQGAAFAFIEIGA